MHFARPEDQLLLCVARQNLDAAAKEEIRTLLGESLDWLNLLTSANRQGVVPLLQKLLSYDEVPPHVAAELHDWNEEICQFNLFLSGELVKLLDVFERNTIRTIPFKGPTLTVQAHGDVGLRQYKDLDILVSNTDFAKVSMLLLDRGFKPVPDSTRAQREALLRFGCAATFVDAGGVIVDVHWRVAERHLGIEIDPGEFWFRLEPVDLGGRSLLTLSAEDMLLVLCCHGYTHSWDRLAWICDVATLIERRKDLDWSYILNAARRAGVLRILLLGLVLAQWLDASLPPEVSRELDHEPVLNKLAEETITGLFAPSDHSLGSFDSLAQELRMRERKRDKIRTLVASFATPREYDWMFASFPAQLWPLYYLIRPIRWGATYAGKLWKRGEPQGFAM